MLSSTHTQWRVKSFMKEYNRGRLNLAPAFQRNSVWTTTDRQRLIVSVFNGIPLPTVFLYKRVHSTTHAVAYDVIDGKQRLEALLLFAREGPLASDDAVDWLRFKSDLDERAAVGWRYWEDLTPTLQREFRDTVLPVIIVDGELSEIAELFVSINSTGRKLTGQEKRHAFHRSSNVLRIGTQLADARAADLLAWGVVSRSQINRMLHIELVTEVLLYAYDGTHPSKKARLDAVIRGDALEAEMLRNAAKDVNAMLNVVGTILPNLRSTRFRKRADFYSLVTLLLQLKRQGQAVNAHSSHRNTLAGELLADFGASVDEVSELSRRMQNVSAGLEEQVKYLATVKEGTDSAQQRIRRASILGEGVLAGVFDQQDPQRQFNEQQRRILWNRSLTKNCALCHKRIHGWEEMHADHVQAYVSGGSTTIGNGAITHQTCNQQVGAKWAR